MELSVIDELEQIAPVLAVHGNMDSLEVKNALPELEFLKIFNWKIGVMHDPSVFMAQTKWRKLSKKTALTFSFMGIRIRSKIKWEEKTLYINPGSPTDPHHLSNKPSVGLLKITKETITAANSKPLTHQEQHQ